MKERWVPVAKNQRRRLGCVKAERGARRYNNRCLLGRGPQLADCGAAILLAKLQYPPLGSVTGKQLLVGGRVVQPLEHLAVALLAVRGPGGRSLEAITLV